MKGREYLEEKLREAGIRLKVAGCGCCDSPWVKAEISGEIVMDADSVRIDMFKEDSDGV